MRVLFIGGTGLISTAVSKLALSSGISLTLLNRGKNKNHDLSSAETITADINDIQSVKSALKGRQFDAVVNWIAFKKSDVERDFELFSGITGQYIFISSAAAYQKPSSRYLITESTPLANPFWEYARNKAECEEYLYNRYKNASFPVTVVRPSHTYGSHKVIFPLTGAKTNWTYINRMLSGKETVVHGDGKSLWTVTHNTDFAKALVGLLGNHSAIGHSFHITSDEALTWDNIISIQASILCVPANIIHIPSDFIAHVLPYYRGPLLGDKAESVVFDNTKVKSFVPSFICTTPFSIGIRNSLETLMSDPSLHVVDEEYNNNMDTLISRYRVIY